MALTLPAIFQCYFQAEVNNSDAYLIGSLYLKTLIYCTISASTFSIIFLQNGKSPKYSIPAVLDALVLAFAVQAFFVLISFTSEAFRDVVDFVLEAKGNLSGLESFRVRGFTNSGGANLSMAMAIVGFISLYLFLEYRKIIYGLTTFLVVISALFIGRSGVVGFTLFSIPLIVVAITCRCISISTATKGLIFIILIIFLITILSYQLDENSILLWWNWFYGEASDSAIDLWSMYFHTFTMHDIFLGKGFFEEPIDGHERSDSGYIKALLSVGAPAAMLFYFGLMVRYVNGALLFIRYSSDKILSGTFCLALLLMALFFEAKEAMLYQNYTGRILLFLFILFLNISLYSRLQRYPAGSPKHSLA